LVTLKVRTVHFLYLAVFFQSCGRSGLTGKIPLSQNADYCAPSVPFDPAEKFKPVQNTDSLISENGELLEILSLHDFLTGNATGILPEIKQLQRNAGDTTTNGELVRIKIKQRIQNRLFQVSTEISGLAAELDCAGERADQMASFLDNRDKKRTNRLTIASVITGSLATVAAVLVSGQGAQNTITIGGGLLSAGLSAFTIKPPGHKMQYEHGRNLLADIWNVPKTSKMYSPAIWYILNERQFSNGKELSLIKSIKERWTEFELSKQDDSQAALLFEKGGIYDADLLHTRATMLNQLQSTIRSIDQDIQSLLPALNRIEK